MLLTSTKGDPIFTIVGYYSY